MGVPEPQGWRIVMVCEWWKHFIQAFTPRRATRKLSRINLTSHFVQRPLDIPFSWPIVTV